MKRIMIMVGLLIIGTFVFSQEWRIDPYPESMKFTIENDFFNYNIVDINDIPRDAMSSLQKAKELYNNDRYYTWFMNSSYLYIYYYNSKNYYLIIAVRQ